MRKFIRIIRDKWLRQTSLTILLVTMLLLAFILINLFGYIFDSTPLDFTKEKIYSLSEDSIKQISQVELNVDMYFFGYEDNSTEVILGKQYEKINDKIKTHMIKVDERPDLASEYGVSSIDRVVAVASNQRYKTIESSEMYTYDMTTFETIDITEQKLTSAILDVTISKKPQVYFLTGHGEYGIEDGSLMYSLAQAITNEVNDVKSLDLLASDMPETCDALIIVNPTKDFTDIETQKIETYINNGGNILWMQDPYIRYDLSSSDFPNANRILSLFGINFEKSIVCEQSETNMLTGSPELIIPELNYNTIVKDIYTDGSIVLFDAGKITTKSDDMLNALNVQASPFIQSTEQAFYRENIESSALIKLDTDESGPFVLGELLEKKIDDEKTAKLIAISNATFATDMTVQLTANGAVLRPIDVRNNKDIVLNSVAYLTNREDSIRIRKEVGLVTYTATEAQDRIVKLIIFGIPLLIIIIGIVVTLIRRRKR